MGWADDMYDAGYTSTHGGLMDDENFADESSLSPHQLKRKREKEKELAERIARLNSFKIPEAQLSKLYLSKIVDCKVISLFDENIIGSRRESMQVSFKLNGVGWVSLAPVPNNFVNVGFYLSDYWDWYYVIDKELKRDASLSHLKGKFIFGSIDNKQGQLSLDQVFSVDVKSDFSKQINKKENSDEHSFNINLPIISLIENDSLIEQHRVRQDYIDIDNLKVYRLKKAGLFCIQTYNKQTLFFREIEDTNILSDKNIGFLRRLLQPEGYYIMSPTLSMYNTIYTGLEKYPYYNKSFRDKGIECRVIRNLIEIENKEQFKKLEVGDKLPKNIINLLQVLSNTLKRCEYKEINTFDNDINFNWENVLTERKEFFESFTIPDSKLSKLYLSRIINCKVTKKVVSSYPCKQISIQVENIGWVDFPHLDPLPSIEGKGAYKNLDASERLQKTDEYKCYDDHWGWFSEIDKEFSKDETLSHLIGNSIFCSIDIENDKLVFDNIFSIDVESCSKHQISIADKEKSWISYMPIVSLLKGDYFIGHPRARVDAISEKGLEIYESDTISGLYYFQTKNKYTVFFSKIDDIHHLTYNNIDIVDYFLNPTGCVYLESNKNYKYSHFNTRRGYSLGGQSVSFNKEIERLKRRNYVFLENKDDYSQLQIGDEIPEEVSQILSVLSQHTKQKKHHSNPVFYKKHVKLSNTNNHSARWVNRSYTEQQLKANSKSHLDEEENNINKKTLVSCLKSLQIGINTMNIELIEISAKGLKSFEDGFEVLQHVSNHNYGLALEQLVKIIKQLESD